ncbi:MAG: hypothetical protein KAH57_11210 [Thermoplasmata archaeon]|nr:hypothetical protein [Thermoplasmata archaeon]
MVKHYLSIPVILLLLAVSAFQPVGSGTRVPDPIFDDSNGVDVPTWSIGDYWNYTTEFTYTMVLEIAFTGWMNMSVVAVYQESWNSMDPVYVMNITGEVDGAYSIPFVGDEEIYIDITGYLWTRMQDLSHYRMVTNASISGTSSLLDDYYGDYPIGYEYYPPLEEYDFPLVPGDQWSVDTIMGIPFSGSSGSPVRLVQNLSCGDPVDISVDAGNFRAFPVDIEGKTSYWYNGTAANSVKRLFSLSLEDMDLDIPLELREYRHTSQETTIRIWVSSPQHVEAGGTFTLSGELGASSSIVRLFFPGGTDAGTKVIVFPTKTFQFQLDAPWSRDDTPTNNDYASLGILAVSVGGSTGYDVCTVTTKARDLAVYNHSISVTNGGDGTIDDPFTANITIYNPFHFSVEGFTVNLTVQEGGINLFTKGDINLEGHENISFDVDLLMGTPGTYTIVLEVDPEDSIAEFNETNNIVNATFEVLDRPLLSFQTSPGPGNYSIEEGNWTVITAAAFRGDEELLEGTWHLDGQQVAASDRFNFTTSYTGNRSSREYPYVLFYELPENTTFEGESDLLQWNISVLDINRPPILQGASPTGDNVYIYEGDNITFSLNVSDPDDDLLIFSWSMDGEPLDRLESDLILRSSFTGNLSSTSSPYDVRATASDQYCNVSINWTLHIIDRDRPFTYLLDPHPGDYTIGFDQVLNISYTANDPDGDPISSRWDLLGFNLTSMDHLLISPSDLNLSGNETFQVLLVLHTGQQMESFTWNITIEEKVTEEPIPGPKGVFITSPHDGETFYSDENITLAATEADEREVTFVWYLDGVEIQGEGPTLHNLPPGNYTIDLWASVPNTEGITLQVNFTVIQRESPQPAGEDGVDKEDDLTCWLIIAIVIVVIAVSAMTLFLLTRRRPEEWDDEE